MSAVVMQGDANDVYKVTGSLDGSPASYKLLAEFANVVNMGHGLRTRATTVTTTKVRYLRVGEANGDNYFSISELGAYCKAPTPFPPSAKIVDVPPTATPDSQATPKPGSDTGRSALLLTAVALALAWLAYKTITRPAVDASKAAEASAPPSDKPAEPPAGGEKPPPSDKTT